MNQYLNSKLLKALILSSVKYLTGPTEVPLQILHTHWDVPIYTFLSGVNEVVCEGSWIHNFSKGELKCQTLCALTHTDQT